MDIDEASLDEFRAIWERVYGFPINRHDAHIEAVNLLRLLKAACDD